jgi:hypothetical protein
MNAHWTPEETARLVALRSEGLCNAAVAAQLGRSVGAIKVRVAKLAIPKRAWTRRQLPPPPSVEVPAWVPPALRADYIEAAHQEGEEAAAAWARREKRAMAA